MPGTGQRFSCYMLSAITNREHTAFRVFGRRFSAQVFLCFPPRSRRLFPCKVYA